jgi:DnaK suppressor protein
MDDDRAAVFALLTAERAGTEAQAAALAADLDGIIAAASLGATDDEHDPEGTTIAYERAHVSSLLADAKVRLSDLDAALARLAAGDYGACATCGRPIAPERLAARPATTTCIDCAAAVGDRRRG